MNKMMKRILVITGAVVLGGILGWAGNMIGLTVPTLVALVLAVAAGVSALLKKNVAKLIPYI